MIIAAKIHHSASHISAPLNEKSSAFKKITVSTHSLTTLAKARIESIQSWFVVTIFSTDFLIFFQIFRKFIFVHIKN